MIRWPTRTPPRSAIPPRSKLHIYMREKEMSGVKDESLGTYDAILHTKTELK